MLIKETIERRCCQQKDLKPIEGTPAAGLDPKYKFCVHCGRHHVGETERDAAGSSDWTYRPMRLPLETK